MAMRGMSTVRAFLTSTGSQRRFVSVKNCRTPLTEMFEKRIAECGPMSFADFMDAAMRHPEHGYFTTKEGIISAKGDFITAPELLPEFGWCLGQWVVEAVARLEERELIQKQSDILLVELGAGTGRMMLQMLTYLQRTGHHDLLQRTHVVMVEVSEVMRSLQRKSLSNISGHLGSLHWASSFSEACEKREAPTMVVSNEFYDVLPVHIMRCVEEGHWVEEMVDVAPYPFTPDKPSFVLKPSSDANPYLTSYLGKRAAAGKPGNRIEVCPQAIDVTVEMARRLEKLGGMALAIDYGRDRPSTNTLQGMQGHVTCSPLLSPGEIDISWHVDFEALRMHIQDSCPTMALTSLLPQREFLQKLGIEMLALEALKRKDLPQSYTKRYTMLMDRLSMGGYHGATVLCPKLAYPPPPF